MVTSKYHASRLNAIWTQVHDRVCTCVCVYLYVFNYTNLIEYTHVHTLHAICICTGHRRNRIWILMTMKISYDKWNESTDSSNTPPLLPRSTPSLSAGTCGRMSSGWTCTSCQNRTRPCGCIAGLSVLPGLNWAQTLQNGHISFQLGMGLCQVQNQWFSKLSPPPMLNGWNLYWPQMTEGLDGNMTYTYIYIGFRWKAPNMWLATTPLLLRKTRLNRYDLGLTYTVGSLALLADCGREPKKQ